MDLQKEIKTSELAHTQVNKKDLQVKSIMKETLNSMFKILKEVKDKYYV